MYIKYNEVIEKFKKNKLHVYSGTLIILTTLIVFRNIISNSGILVKGDLWFPYDLTTFLTYVT